MLLKFRFSNFRSFRTEQELSLIASKLPGSGDGLFSPPGLREQVLPVAAIYGANASGKTAVIKAFEFMANAVKFSHSQWQPDQRIPTDPFAGDDPALPSEFSADFLLDGIRHQYGFAASPQAILREWLYVYPKSKRQVWFERAEGTPISFGAKMPGENKVIEGLTRKNSLFLSTAAQNNHEVLAPVYRWFSQSISFVIGNLGLASRVAHNESTAQFCQEEVDKATITRLLTQADLGIEGLRIENIPWPDITKKILEAVRTEVTSMPELPETRKVVRILHHVGNQTVPFEAEQESSGTLAYLALAGPVVSLLKNGGTLLVDELDTSLHPLMAVQILRLFGSSTSNPRSAQLIFNTHDTNLLSSGDLRRDQIWFTEKDSTGSSHLYPLTDFKPRRQENLENGYLQGRYGAIPFIHPDYLTGNAGGNGEKS
jgi:AAA15 family ATPase/GTPase